jgi:catabolite regulation protein CreA
VIFNIDVGTENVIHIILIEDKHIQALCYNSFTVCLFESCIGNFQDKTEDIIDCPQTGAIELCTLSFILTSIDAFLRTLSNYN